MTTLTAEQKELVTLRVSVARIAQQLGLGKHIPGPGPADDNYQGLWCRAIDNKHGWNSLCRLIVGELQGFNTRKDHQCL